MKALNLYGVQDVRYEDVRKLCLHRFLEKNGRHPSIISVLERLMYPH